MNNLSSPISLATYVTVRGRYARSVHLERDWGRRNGTTDYHLTPSAYELLVTIAGAEKRPTDRSLTVVGPYGAGKSAFCVFLAGLVSGGKSERVLLSQRDPLLARSLGAPKNRLLPIPVVGAREPLARAMVNGLVSALQSQNADVLNALQADLESAKTLESDDPTPRSVADLYERAAQIAVEQGYAGVLLLADELGKFLEYAALHPKDGDIFTLQEMAEVAARSVAPFYIVAVLHQNADAYAQKLGRSHQAEWAKVGERFREVPFFPSDTERMDMVGLALKHAPELHLNGNFSRLTAQESGHLPQSVSKSVSERFGVMARAAYPLHPTVLLALPSLFRKTGQSHRSLFNFLSGEEAHALGRFLRESSYTPDAPPLFMLDALFDYTAEVLLGGWSAGGLARLWAEAVESVDRALQVSTDARRVLKCIALLGLLRDPHLPASTEVLTWALTGTDGHSPDIEAALAELGERRLIAWSRTRELYRLWEGGDVDIEAALETARSGLPAGTTLRAATDRNLCPLPRLMARRYSFETGTLRTVETHPCAATDLQKVLKESEGLSVVLCLAPNADEAQRAEATAREASNANVLVAIALETEILREAASDVAAAGEVAANVSALQNDRAARRELDARRFEAENAFRDEWERLFGETSRFARWFYAGESIDFDSRREFSAFLSRMAYAFYPATPILRNELVNRKSLSSAAAAGRRALIEAMLTHGDRERLGIEKFPPEFSMYECLLRVTGLHRRNASGAWEFGAPLENDGAKLRKVWQALESEIFVSPPAPRPVKAIWQKLAAPPFGLSEGVMPPLLMAFLLAHKNETTLYRDGTYLPEPGVPDWEILLRRPEHFAVAGSRIESERSEVVERMAKGLGVEPYAVPVAQALIRNMRRLPEHARRTSKLPEATKALRRALDGVASPEKLLFSDLPQAFGVTGLLSEVSAGEIDVEAFFSTLNGALVAWNTATPDMIARARDTLLEACGLPQGTEGWSQLRRDCRALEGRIAQADLIPFINRAAETGDDSTVLDSVVALVANRPPRMWSDTDEERFSIQVRAIGEHFRAATRPESWASSTTSSGASPQFAVPENTPPQVALSGATPTMPQVPTSTERARVRKLTDAVLAQLSEVTPVEPRAIQCAALRLALQELEKYDA